MILSYQQGTQLPVVENLRELFQRNYTNPQRHFFTVVFTLATYGPLLAAVIVTYLENGKTGLVNLWHQIIKWRISWRWYVTIIGVAVIITTLPIGLGALTGLVKLNTVTFVDFIPQLIPFFLVQVLTSGLGEEPGWRGFLLPRLQTSFTGTKPIWLLGLIWAIWHYPLTIYYTLPQLVGTPSWVGILIIITALAGQTMMYIGITALYVWIYNNTRSVFISILLHALINTFSAIPFGEIQPAISLLLAIMPWIVVVFLEKALPKSQFPGSPQLATQSK